MINNQTSGYKFRMEEDGNGSRHPFPRKCGKLLCNCTNLNILVLLVTVSTILLVSYSLLPSSNFDGSVTFLPAFEHPFDFKVNNITNKALEVNSRALWDDDMLRINFMGWKKFFKHHSVEVLLLPSGANDGLGHRLQRLYSTIHALDGYGVSKFRFTGYDEIISQDAVYINSRKKLGEKLYCHSLQSWNENKKLFRSLRLKVKGENKYDVNQMLDLITKGVHRKEAKIVRWVNSLKCEYVDFDSYHSIGRVSLEEVNKVPGYCNLDPMMNPAGNSRLAKCEQLIFRLGDVDKTAAARSSQTKFEANKYFGLGPVDTALMCGYNPDAVNIAIHFRFGDKAVQDAHMRESSFQTAIQNLVRMFSKSNVPIFPAQIHVFTELVSPCEKTHHVKELPSVYLHEKCQCQVPPICPEREFMDRCLPNCPPRLQGDVKVQMKDPAAAEHATKILQINQSSNSMRSPTVPITLHGSAEAVITDLDCMRSSDILVIGCSYFSSFAGILSDGLTVRQECQRGTQTGKIFGDELMKSQRWHEFVGKWTKVLT